MHVCTSSPQKLQLGKLNMPVTTLATHRLGWYINYLLSLTLSLPSEAISPIQWFIHTV